MKYRVITGYNTDDLSIQVNQEMKKGWEPFGGVSISVSTICENQYYDLAQVMTKSFSDIESRTRYTRFLLHFALIISMAVPCGLLLLLRALGVF